MPIFQDTNGREWSLRFDGLTLARMRDDLKVNLADVGGGDYSRIEGDEGELVRVLAFLCRKQIETQRLSVEQFSEAMTGESLENAMQAIWGAAKLFFPPKRWSALLTNSVKHRTNRENWEAMSAERAMLDQIPEALKDSVMAAISEKMEASLGDLQRSAANPSASGPEAIQLRIVSDTPENAESTPAG